MKYTQRTRWGSKFTRKWIIWWRAQDIRLRNNQKDGWRGRQAEGPGERQPLRHSKTEEQRGADKRDDYTGTGHC